MTGIAGDADQVEWLAREYGRYAAGACDAARALRRIDTGAWVGPAGDAFRSAIGEVPDKLDRGQASFARAATALAGYARVLREAQADAAAAERRAADEGAEAGRALHAAQERVDAAASRAAGVLDDARRGAPHEPGLLSKAVHAVGSFLRGAGEATWGLAEFAYTTSPTYALIDPKGFLDHAADMGKGVVYGVEHPKELGKALIDYDTWRDDPARALGHLVPDLVLAVATAGAGEAGVAAGRVAEGADAMEQVATRGVRAAAVAAELSEEEVALLERRFASPAEAALDFQGEAPYVGRDSWRDTVMMPGETFSVGTPGEGRFAATADSVAEVGTDARRYYEGLQVRSRTDADGVARYRSHLSTYEVRRPLPVAASVAEANAQFGAGGLAQVFLPDSIKSLLADGFISDSGVTAMTGLDAAIGPKGLTASPLVPLARGAAAGGGTLTLAGAARAGGCG